jgi:hypothetical protein
VAYIYVEICKYRNVEGSLSKKIGVKTCLHVERIHINDLVGFTYIVILYGNPHGVVALYDKILNYIMMMSLF